MWVSGNVCRGPRHRFPGLLFHSSDLLASSSIGPLQKRSPNVSRSLGANTKQDRGLSLLSFPRLLWQKKRKKERIKLFHRVEKWKAVITCNWAHRYSFLSVRLSVFLFLSLLYSLIFFFFFFSSRLLSLISISFPFHSVFYTSFLLLFSPWLSNRI